MGKVRVACLVCLLLLPMMGGSGGAAFYLTLYGTCVGVADGDTITVLTAQRVTEKIRLSHIDCPERGQPYGARAKQFTSDFCFGRRVSVVHRGKRDRNRRLIGEVYNDRGEQLNKALVRAGLAWHFLRYSDDTAYTRLEAQARAAGTGLWRDAHPVPPWSWRKSAG